MLAFSRQRVVACLAAVLFTVTGAVPAQVWADCCCRQATLERQSCCARPAVPACGCAAVESKATCCPSQVQTSAANVPPTVDSHGGCQCTRCECFSAPATPAVPEPRPTVAPGLELDQHAAFLVVFPGFAAEKGGVVFPSTADSWLPPPARERLCVWII